MGHGFSTLFSDTAVFMRSKLFVLEHVDELTVTEHPGRAPGFLKVPRKLCAETRDMARRDW